MGLKYNLENVPGNVGEGQSGSDAAIEELSNKRETEHKLLKDIAALEKGLSPEQQAALASLQVAQAKQGGTSASKTFWNAADGLSNPRGGK